MSIDLTLDRIRILSSHLPAYTRPTCHIAGTNGKGSVSALLSYILHASSLSVGRFNSPHLVSIYDCVAINNEPVSVEAYESARKEVELADKEHGAGASSFELLTLTALLIFERARLDIVVVEVGMGGRMDATNIIPDDCILVSAVTAVDFDHMAFLGSNVTDIAKEKAGIARRGKPFVLGQQKYGEVEDVVRLVVEGVGGQVVLAGKVEAGLDISWGDDFSLWPGNFKPPPPSPVRISMPNFSHPVNARLPLYGNHQLANLSIATTVVSTLLSNSPRTSGLREKITSSSIAHGIECTTWPGRLSFHTLSIPKFDTHQDPVPLIILVDGSHNPSSSSTLASYISYVFHRVPADSCADSEPRPKTISLTFILALSHSPPKSPDDTLLPLFPTASYIPSNIIAKLSVAVVGFSPPHGMPWVKPVTPPELKDVVLRLAPGTDIFCAKGDIQRTELEEALVWAAEMQEQQGRDGGLVVIAGSLYLVADFYRILEGNHRRQTRS